MTKKPIPAVVLFPDDAITAHTSHVNGAASDAPPTQPAPTDTEPTPPLPVGYYKELQAHMPLVLATGVGCDGLFAQITTKGVPTLYPIMAQRVADELVAFNDRITGGDPKYFLTRAKMRGLREYMMGTSHRTAERRAVFKRLAWSPEERAIRLDLSRPDGTIVNVTADGWELEVPSKPMFVRYPSQRPAPIPESSDDGAAAFARMCTPGMSAELQKLLLGTLVGCLVPSNFTGAFSYPVILFKGEEGSGKTTLARTIKQLIDPEVTSTAAKPTKIDDLFVTAQSSFLLSYDNLDAVKGDLSDALCQIATGSAISKRRLYTDSDLVVLPAHAPVLLTGIAVDLPRADLIDRLVTIPLTRITEFDPDVGERTAAEAGLVLRYLLDHLSVALRHYDSTTLANPPRLATLAKIVAAAEPFGCDTPFVDLLRANQTEALMSTDEYNPVIAALVELVTTVPTWTGTVGDLLTVLATKAGSQAGSPEWPKTPRKLTAIVKMRQRLLREMGIVIIEGARQRAGRIVTVRRTNAFAAEPSAA